MQMKESGLRPAFRYWLMFVIGWVFLTMALGGATRLLEAGLSIVDWRPVTGIMPPITSTQWLQEFSKYQGSPDFKARSLMTLADFKFIFWWEYAHRLIARMLGFLIIVPFLFFWRQGRTISPDGKRVLLLLFLVGMQGGLGWFMVQSGLVQIPRVSHFRLLAHFLWACLILSYLAFWLQQESTKIQHRRGQRIYLHTLSFLCVVQLALGAMVAGSRAGYVFNTFPLMGDSWGPPVFLIYDGWVENLFYNQFNLQFFHRIGGWVLGLLAVLGWRLGFRELTLLIFLQFILGVFTLVLRVPVSLAVLHQILGAFVFFRIRCLLYSSKLDLDHNLGR